MGIASLICIAMVEFFVGVREVEGAKWLFLCFRNGVQEI